MSRYSLYRGTNKRFTTLQVSATSVRTTVTSRRLAILSAGIAPFMEIGTGTVVATTASCVIPANSSIDFSVTTGTHIAFISPSGLTYVTLIDIG